MPRSEDLVAFPWIPPQPTPVAYPTPTRPLSQERSERTPPGLAADLTFHRGGNMTDQNEARVKLATRIPRRLHREMKLHCVSNEVSLMAFVVDALREKLASAAGETPGRRRNRRAS